MNNKQEYSQYGLGALESELESIIALKETINSSSFNQACDAIFNHKSKLIVMGVGKSGHIAKKISASLSSTGTPSIFVHPTEACHGDAGILQANDLVIYISNSGESIEFNALCSVFKKLNIKLIAITNNCNSTLAKNSDIYLYLNVLKEACPHNLAPTSSTTNTLVLGDAIMIALLNKRKFNKNNFAISHPFGTLGKRLLLTVKDLMHSGEDIPLVTEDISLSNSLIEITKKRLGVVIIHNNLYIIGIFTDGDLRRVIKSNDINNTRISEVMTKNFTIVSKDTLAIDALDILNSKSISVLPVVESNKIIGIIHLHDILKSGII